jgi:hypothetical protein
MGKFLFSTTQHNSFLEVLEHSKRNFGDYVNKLDPGPIPYNVTVPSHQVSLFAFSFRFFLPSSEWKLYPLQTPL